MAESSAEFEQDRYGRDPNGTWAVLDYDGNPLAGRWTSEDAAYEGGMGGKYLFSGYDVADLSEEAVQAPLAGRSDD